MPAVSTNRHVVPPSSMSSSTGSLVVPATESTTARCSPASLLSRLDLPTFGRPFGQRLEQEVEQVAAAAAVHRADHHWLAEAKGPQRLGVGLALRVVDLVRREHDRLARAP